EQRFQLSQGDFARDGNDLARHILPGRALKKLIHRTTQTVHDRARSAQCTSRTKSLRQYPACAGRIMRLSLTARTPGMTSAATRSSFFSNAESTTPHNSPVPSCTITLINDVRIHDSALSCVSTFSRISTSLA